MAAQLQKRRRMRRVPLAILLLATPARADGPAETIEAEQRDLALVASDAPGFHAQAFAQLTGGRAAAVVGDAAVGAELRYTTSRCDALRLGGQARLGYSDGTHASAEQWASFCVSPIVMEFGHHLEWDVRPSLLAPLELRPGANRRETVSFHWEPVRFRAADLYPREPGAPPPTTKGELIVFDVRTDLTLLWVAHGDIADRETAEAVPFRYLRAHTSPWGEARDYTVDVGVGGGEFTQEAASVYFWLARVQNLQLGSIYASAGGGVASAEAGPFVTMTKREIALTTLRGMVQLETGNSLVHGYVRGTNNAALHPDGYAMIDRRLTGGIVLTHPALRVGLEGAAALTQVYVPMQSRITARTGGGSLTVARSLTHNLQATFRLDVARSFFAPTPSMTMQDFTPRWGVQAFGALQATVGR